MFLKCLLIWLFSFLILLSCTSRDDDSKKLFQQSKETANNSSCVQIGEQLVISGGSPGRWTFSKQCCEGLSSISQPEDATNGAAPGRIICAACGDGHCDPKFENKLNCSDCK